MNKDLPDDTLARRRTKRALDALPKSYSVQWTPSTKAVVVQAVEGGWLMLDEALTRYRMSLEEYQTWQDAFKRENRDVAGEHPCNVVQLARPALGKALHRCQ